MDYRIEFIIGPRAGVSFDYIIGDVVSGPSPPRDKMVVIVTTRGGSAVEAFEHTGAILNALRLSRSRAHTITYASTEYGQAEHERLSPLVTLICQWIQEYDMSALHDRPACCHDMSAHAPAQSRPRYVTDIEREYMQSMSEVNCRPIANIVERYLSAPNQPEIDIVHPKRYQRMRNQVLNLSRGTATPDEVTAICAELARGHGHKLNLSS